jgi:hypothetical protein
MGLLSWLKEPTTGTINKHLASAIKRGLAPPAYLNPSYTSFSEDQGQIDYKIQTNINEMNFRGMTVTQVTNKIAPNNLQTKQNLYFRQLVMPWNNEFMPPDSSQPQRLNNPAHASFLSQRQMTIPNTYGQFYAFMHALSAVFGTLQQ